MAKAVGAERLERATHRGRPDDFAGVRNRAQPFGFRQRERRLVWLRRVLRLEPTETDADDSALALAGGPTNCRDGLVERVAAWDIWG